MDTFRENNDIKQLQARKVLVQKTHLNGAQNNHEDLCKKRKLSDTALMTGVFNLIEEEINKTHDRSRKVTDFKLPEEISELIDLDVDKTEGESPEELLKLCKQTMKYSVNTCHPRFFNQLYGGRNFHALAGALLTELMNPSLYTYEVAPVFTVMEEVVLKKVRDIIGFEDGDGIFNPGGSVSNIYAMSLARHHAFPECKSKGLQAMPPVCVFVSEETHYSATKAAILLGIGTDNVVKVPSDDKGKMRTDMLDTLITERKNDGFYPLMVYATGGTTVFGAYDPIDQIADVCEKHSTWLHTDICWGGGVLFSQKHKHLVDGIHRSDSVAWNPHKMVCAIQQCCLFVTRHKTLLRESHGTRAAYLFQPDKHYDISYDVGDKSIQCGRKVDVFKLWLMWKAMGLAAIERSIDKMFNMASYLKTKLIEHPNFRMVIGKPECTNTCFWYIPPSLLGQEETEEWWQKLSMVAPKIKARMLEKGSMMITYQPTRRYVNFFRFVLCNPDVTTEDMDFVVEEIARLGEDL